MEKIELTRVRHSQLYSSLKLNDIQYSFQFLTSPN
ncbi:hypothetical protein SAMN05444412_113107 [Rhodonellum ikkaensis]|uniref:Uncharacterized protein n=1 Tax=Rhodonellum ikkaensis TaxID=336829 RepID=A0A1H3SUG5_9BACT|nr:hypothetical protein SAMN05444412_113107 [Rhodonellum ikkaensis]